MTLAASVELGGGMTLAVALIVGAVLVGAVLAFATLASPGPSRPIVAVHRYGAWPYVTAVVIVAAAAAFITRPDWRSNVGSLAVLAVPALLVATARRRLLARAILRARWPSVARSCGLGVRRDVRGRQWPFDVTVTIGDQHVEHLPRITHPRLVPGVGIEFRLVPARGGTIDQVAQAAEALAAGLRVARVEVTRLAPSRGELLAVWR